MHRVFWCEPTGEHTVTLRRHTKQNGCPEGDSGIHWRENLVRGPFTHNEKGRVDTTSWWDQPDHPDWPSQCGCGYIFTPEDERSTTSQAYYRRTDTGEVGLLGDFPPGAMWDAHWMSRKGPDGICLVVLTPGGHWMVDGRASNCDKKEDNEHYCWIRHGDPRTGMVHVDKNGVTCNAGGGSIGFWNHDGSFRYHAFLHHGELREC